MWRRHFIRNLHTALFVAVAVALLAAATGLWWANRTGLPETWRATIEREIAKQGANVTIDSLSYVPFRGLIARGVRVFSDKERREEVARLERVILNFDKAKLARREFRLTKIELKDANLSLPLDPINPDSTLLEVTHVDGIVLMPGGRLIEAREMSGEIAGIKIVFGARILNYRPDGEPEDVSKNRRRRETAALIVRELEHWKFGGDKKPVLRVFVEGDLDEKSTLVARLDVQAREIEKNGHVLDEIHAEGTLAGHLLTLTSIRASDSRGNFSGRIDYDLNEGDGRFDIVSGMEIPELLKAWLGLPGIPHISVAGKQTLEAEGEFEFGPWVKTSVRVTGSARAESVLLRGVPFDAVGSAFSWRDGTLFLRDLVLARSDGKAAGKALIHGNLVQLAINSTLPSDVILPFFVGQPIEMILKDFGKMAGAKVNVDLEGGFDTRDRFAWAYSGSGEIENMTFRGVPVAAAKCKFSLSTHELDFYDGTVVFNYDNYALQNAFNGPNRGTAKVARVRYDAREKQVEIDRIEGNIWAAPMVRLFAARIADSLETYRFHRPPLLRGSGVVDVTPQGRTSLAVSFNSASPADYKFLGENLTLGSPAGDVLIRGDRVTVDDLKLEAFGGPVAARFDYLKKQIDAEASWNGVNLAGIASTYGFEIKGGGSTTGRIEFSCEEGKINTMEGVGLLAVDNTELFSVPMLGPLSALVSGVLGEKKGAGYQHARDAFMNFRIQKGVMSTTDFRTTTSSLVFTGDGSIDLTDRDIDMTIRMNARGFLGLITLPLRPFYGLFQFRGTGPMKDTKWKSELFTSPPEAQRESLLSPPKARIVREN